MPVAKILTLALVRRVVLLGLKSLDDRPISIPALTRVRIVRLAQSFAGYMYTVAENTHIDLRVHLLTPLNNVDMHAHAHMYM